MGGEWGEGGWRSVMEKRKSGRRLRRVLVWGVVVVVVLLVLVVLLAPMVAGSFAPGMIERAAGGKLTAGSLSVDKASLSWWGPIRVGPVVLADADGSVVAEVDAELSRGLLGLAGAARGSKNLGDITVNGSADIIVEPDGRTNVERLFGITRGTETAGGTGSGGSGGGGGAGGTGGTGGESAQLIRDLAGRVLLDAMHVTYTDPAIGGTVAIRDLTANLSIQTGAHAKANAKATLGYGKDVASAMANDSGTVTFTATGDGLDSMVSDGLGGTGTFSATIDASKVSVDLIDRLAGQDGRLASAIGPSLDVQIKAAGDKPDHVTADLKARSRSFRADTRLAYADNRVGTVAPVVIEADGPVLSLVPGLDEALSDPDGVLALKDRPSVRLTIADLDVPLGRDLRGASVSAAATVAAMSGTVRTPGEVGEEGGGVGAKAFATEQIELRLTTADLGKSLQIEGESSAMIAGEPAGALVVDIKATDLLDGQGAVSRSPSVTGRVMLTELATALAQPFAEAAGVDLARAVGPELDVELWASARLEEGQKLPTTDLSLDVTGEHLRVGAKAAVHDGVLALRDEGLRAEADAAGAVVGGMLADVGVTVKKGGAVTLSSKMLRVDVPRLLGWDKPEAEGLDLRAVSGVLDVRTLGQTAGTIALGGESHGYELAPTTLTVDARDLATVKTKANSQAKLDGKPAGSVSADLAILGVLDGNGAVRAALPAMNGRVQVKSINSVVLDQLLADAGVRVTELAGPRLDVDLVATVQDDGGLPRTNLDLKIESKRLHAKASVSADDKRIAARGDGIEISGLAGRLIGVGLKPETGWSAGTGGTLSVATKDLVIPLEAGTRRPMIEKLAGQIDIHGKGMVLHPIRGVDVTPETPLRINRADIVVTADGAGSAKVGLDHALAYKGEAFSATGSLELPGVLAGKADGPPIPVRGTVDLTGVPMELAKLIEKAGAEGGGSDLAGMLTEVVGQKADLHLALGVDGKKRSSVNATVTADRLNVKGGVLVGTDAAELMPITGQVKLVSLSKLMPAPADGGEEGANGEGGDGEGGAIELAEAVTFTLTTQRVRVPLGDGMTPDWAGGGGAGVFGATIEAPGRVMLTGLGESTKPMGVEKLKLRLTVPLKVLAEGQTGDAELNLSGRLLDSQGGLGWVTAHATAAMSEMAPAGKVTANVQVKNLGPRYLDQLAGQDWLVAGMFGGAIQGGVQIDANVTGPIEPGWLDKATAKVEASVDSPKFKTTRPLRLAVDEHRINLTKPFEASWEMSPVWANRYALGIDPDSTEPPPAVFAEPAPVTVTLGRFAMARGGVPMAPGVFHADVAIKAQRVVMKLADGSRAAYERASIGLVSKDAPGAFGYQMELYDAAANQGKGPAVRANGALWRVSDKQGVPTPDDVIVNSTVKAPRLPMALIDALARQDGLLVELLGPYASVDATLREFSRTSGKLRATADSPRAHATITGHVENGLFMTDAPAVVQLQEVTPEAGEKLVQWLPLVGSIEKRREDGPATVTLTGLRLPLEGGKEKTRKLNGTVAFDLGTARYKVNTMFATMMSAVNLKDAGSVGQHFDPFSVRVTDGMLKYDRINLPLGEFSIETEGGVDLVEQQVDVVTYIPLGALTDEAAGLFNTGLGSAVSGLPGLNQLSMLPFRTRGTYGNTKTEPDMKLFMKSFSDQLLAPDKVIEDIFKGLGGG